MSKNWPGRRWNFIFASSNSAWGGSEELWSATAALLAAEGHRVTVFANLLDNTQPRIQELRRRSCAVRGFPWSANFGGKIHGRLSQAIRLLAKLNQAARLWLNLLLSRSDLVVISQGLNTDGMMLAMVCRMAGAPYIVIAHNASELYWPRAGHIPRLRAMYRDALASYFVSTHGRHLTEEQLGIVLPRAAIVRNPFNVPWAPRKDWPDMDEGVRLACIGRLHPPKGQDVLLRVLARDKWRSQPVSVTFYGEGPQMKGLQRSAASLELANVAFAEFVRDVSAIWNSHHGLVLASRYEGLPLVLVETMLAGRVAIMTAVGGIREIVNDGETGFLIAAPTENGLDEALERAWRERARWQEIGQAAARKIRTLVPPDPAGVFAEELKRLAAGKKISERPAEDTL